MAQLLKNDVPHLFIIKCVCHSLALCSSFACLKLPSAVETLTRNVYNYLSNSPKRTNEFNYIQTLLEINPKKIVHPSQTRWLSIEAVVVRLLELYEPLKIYFSFAVNIDHIDTAKHILENLNETNQIYLSFLKYVLPILNNKNKMFQGESTEIHILYVEMERLLKIIMSNFVKSDVLQNNNIFLTDYKNSLNFLDYQNVYLGIYAKEISLKPKLSQSDVVEIIKNCTNFHIEL